MPITTAGWRRAATAARIAIWTVNAAGIAAVAAAIAGRYWPSTSATVAFAITGTLMIVAVLFTGARARLAEDDGS